MQVQLPLLYLEQKREAIDKSDALGIERKSTLVMSRPVKHESNLNRSRNQTDEKGTLSAMHCFSLMADVLRIDPLMKG
jgi:hypothetical protein